MKSVGEYNSPLLKTKCAANQPDVYSLTVRLEKDKDTYRPSLTSH